MKRVYPLAFLAMLFVVVSPAAAAQKSTATRGEVLVRKNCSRCHAIGKTGESHTPKPPLSAFCRANIHSRTYPSPLPRALSLGIPTCRSSFSAPTTWRPSWNI